MKNLNSVIIEGTIINITKRDIEIILTIKSENAIINICTFETTRSFKLDELIRIIGTLQSDDTGLYVNAENIQIRRIS